LSKAHHKLGQFSNSLKAQSAKELLESLRGLPSHQTHTPKSWCMSTYTSDQHTNVWFTSPFVSLSFKDKVIRTTKAQPIPEVAIMRKTN